MKKMKKILVLLLAFILTISVFAGCGAKSTPAAGSSSAPAASGGSGEPADTPAEPANTDPLKVGAIFPLSGGNALLGSQCLAGIQIAVDFVNEAGGVQGRQIALTEADAPDPTAATTEASRLIDQQGVEIIFGSLASGNALAIAGVTEKSGITLVEAGGIANELTNSGFQHAFRIIDSGGLRGGKGVEYVGDVLAPMLGIPVNELKVAIIHEESSYGTGVADGAEAQAKAMGMQVVLRESYNTSITDMSAMVLNLKKEKPDVLFTANYVNDAILLVDTLRQYDAMPKVMMGCGAGTTSTEFASTIGPDSDGIFCTDMPTNLPITAFDSDPELKATVQAFRDRMLAEFPDLSTVPVAAEAAFAGAYTFLHNVLPNAKTLDSAGIREAAIATDVPLTALGFGWDVDETGQNQSARANINQWQDGAVQTVYPEALKTADVINVPLPIAAK
ncbi:ABC transporter ATP-binding protein [Clostridia bacterium]|nr:ABC transporter ATP-binding protein [Clostridia bacterium]